MAAVAGLAGHALWMTLWGVGFTMAAQSLRPVPAFAVALVLALAGSFLSASLIPSLLGAVRFASLLPVHMALVLILMAASLVTGRTIAGDG
jgi:hypothetical protein